MRYAVLLTAGAHRDLARIVDYIAEKDSPESAKHVLDRLAEVVTGLEAFPERGSRARELLELGMHEYRQVFFKPYRLIYRVRDKTVHVHLIADGRRDMQSLLRQRLLE